MQGCLSPKRKRSNLGRVSVDSMHGRAQREEHFPPGPQNLRELYNCYADDVHSFTSAEHDRLWAHVEDGGIKMNSNYSGMMTEQESLWRPLCQHAMLRSLDESFVMDRLAFAYVCDNGRTPQFLVIQHSKAWHGNKLCLHNDVRAYLQRPARKHLEGLYSKAATKGLPMEDAYAEGLDWIVDNLDKAYNEDMRVECLVHHRKCRVDNV